MKATVISAAIGLALAAPLRAEGFRAIARDLASAAKHARIERVAVMPFVAEGGSASREGWSISEHLVTQLVMTRKVKAVERSLLKKLLEEHSLGQTGALDPLGLKSLGKIFAVDGIVTGSFATVGRDAVVDARLIDVETGEIVAAAERKVERDTFDAPEDETAFFERPIVVPAPEFMVSVPRIEPADASQLRDSPNDDPCAGAADRVDALEGEILDLKARYWALQLRDGLRLESLKSNPGSTITDPSLKQAFYARLEQWSRQPKIPRLDEEEVRRFVSVDRRAYSLSQQCGI